MTTWTRLFRYERHLLSCIGAVSIIGNNDLVVLRSKILRKQCTQAAREQVWPLIRGDDHRDTRLHALTCSFSRMNGPITSASSGEVQKHSTASRGVQTIGSPLVLNEVLTSTGTPVRAWNAFSRS